MTSEAEYPFAKAHSLYSWKDNRVSKDTEVRQMSLGRLIDYLKEKPLGLMLPLGFINPHSYRGFYEDLAFEPAKDVLTGEMLTLAEQSLGTTFEGHKGGDFKMDEYTNCWLAFDGSSYATTISRLLMDLLYERAK